MPRLIWTLTILLIVIGLLAVARRTYVLLYPPETPRFAAAAAMDSGFAKHPRVTFIHILPAALFFLLIPFQFVRCIRARHLAWHRWSGRLLLILAVIIAASALRMSFTMAIGGANETAATTLYAILFLIFLALGYWNIRHRRIVQHREWMIRAFGVSLGIATTRPIVGIFFAARRLSLDEFFDTAFWLGFTLTLLGAETWIQYTRTRPVKLELSTHE